MEVHREYEVPYFTKVLGLVACLGHVCVVVFNLGRLSRKVIFPFSPSFFFFFPLPISFPSSNS